MKCQKIMAAVLAVLLLFSQMAFVTVNAASAVTLSVSSASGTRGDTVNVSVNISAGSQMKAGDFELHYDPGVLEVKSAEKGTAISAAPIINKSLMGKIVFSYANTNAISGAGSLMNVSFRIKENAPYGKSNVELLLKDLSGGDFQSLDTTVRSGAVTVIAPKLEAPGYVDFLSVGDDYAQILWEAVDGATGYHLYLNGERFNEMPITDNFATIDGLTPDMAYDLTITSIHYTVESDLSVVFPFSTNKARCMCLFVVPEYDADGNVANYQQYYVSVEYGGTVTPPEIPEREGYVLTGWNGELTNITQGMIYTPIYSAKTFSVVFVDYDDSVVSRQTVEYGKSATAPQGMTREGYTFTGWDKDFSKITGDLTVKAVYEKNECQHAHTALRNAVASTCIAAGYSGDTVCTDCQTVLSYGEELPLASHSYVATVVPATPDAQGYTLHECTVCHDSYKDTYVDYVAEDTARIVIDTVTAKSGEKVILQFKVADLPKIKSLGFSGFSYDTAKLELVEGRWLISGTIVNFNPTRMLAAATFDGNVELSGAVFEMEFRVKENVEDCLIPVTCNVTAKMKNENTTGETEIPVAMVSGGVQVINYITGDLDGDEVVTSDDAIYLLYYTLMPDLFPVDQPCDYDGDGEVTSDDAIYLLYYTLMPDLFPLT